MEVASSAAKVAVTLKNPSTTQEGVWSFSICLGSIGISQFIFVANPKAKVPASQCLLVVFANGVWLKTMPKRNVPLLDPLKMYIISRDQIYRYSLKHI